MSDKIKLSELPENGEYRHFDDTPTDQVVCMGKWISFDHGVGRGEKYYAPNPITRDEAIAILRERGQLDEGEARPFHVGDRVRVVRKATEAEAKELGWIDGDMDYAIGRVGKAVEVTPRGARVAYEGQETAYTYPACVLAHADEPAQLDNRIYCDHPGCGKDITPSGGKFNHAELKAGLGGKTYCDEHQSAKAKLYVAMAATPAQPDPIAALTRRVEALERARRHDECFIPVTPSAPPMPPLPEVPECGYWSSIEDQPRRFVMSDPVDYRIPKKGDGYFYLWDGKNPIAGVACDDHDESYGPRFILRELVQPAAPDGYEIVGWGKPKKDDQFIDSMSSGVARAGTDLSMFAWLLKPLPKVRRWEESVFQYVAAGIYPSVGRVPLIDDGTGPTLDRERVALEWMEANVGEEEMTPDERARLAEIRAK